MKTCDVLIVGGGPAGLAAAAALWKKGVCDLMVVEREKKMGGILKQCIHEGFGLLRFGQNLSGPEYARRYIDEMERLGIPCLTDAAVVELTKEKVVTIISPRGLEKIAAKTVVLAMGCRERTRGAVGIPGERPAGVYTAGVAQAYMNVFNRAVGRKVVILGSGDIGMIMARRLTLEGAKVLGVFEIQSVPGGLRRNQLQCLEDYDIPLYLNHTITQIHGKARINGVTVAQVDGNRQPIAGTERRIACDTLILSVGLIPENDLSREAGVELSPETGGPLVDESFQTSVPGIFAAGNVLHVHDLVDHVSAEAEKMAQGVIEYLRGENDEKRKIRLVTRKPIASVVPQYISGQKDVVLSIRLKEPVAKGSILCSQDGQIIDQVAISHTLPAQMLHVALRCEKMGKGSGEIEVSYQ